MYRLFVSPMLPRVARRHPRGHYEAVWGVCMHTGATPRDALWNVIVYRLLSRTPLYVRLRRWW